MCRVEGFRGPGLKPSFILGSVMRGLKFHPNDEGLSPGAPVKPPPPSVLSFGICQGRSDLPHRVHTPRETTSEQRMIRPLKLTLSC